MNGPSQAIVKFLRSCNVPDKKLALLHDLKLLRRKLVQANAKTNLTRITSEDEFWCKHVADSLSIGRVFPEVMQASLRVADVGSGAGFPLLVLAWVNPRLELTGIERRERKAAFIADAAGELGFNNCSVLARQAREAADIPEYRESFDLVLARAVASSEQLVRETRKLARPGSGAKLIFYKTPGLIEKEHRAAQRIAAKYGYTLRYSAPFILPYDQSERQFAVVEIS